MTGQPNTLTADRVRGNATRLLLTNLAGEAETLAGRAEAAQLGYLEFVDLLLEEEVGVREGRRFRNALKLSGLPHHKTLDDFDFAFQPDLDARKVRDLAALGFVRAHANVALLGPPGVGKSHLAVALAVAGCQAGFSIYFTSLDDMVRHLAVAERTGNLPKKLQTYLKPSLLVIDEIGYLPLDRNQANLVFQLCPDVTNGGPSSSPQTRPLANGGKCSVTTSSPPRFSTGSSTIATSSASPDRVIGSKTGSSPRRTTPPAPTTPARDDDRDDARYPTPGLMFPRSGRQRFRSHACRQRAFRPRQPRPEPHPVPAAPPRRAVSVYACPSCDTRYSARQRCDDGNTWCTRPGTGGNCPNRGEPVTTDELLAAAMG